MREADIRRTRNRIAVLLALSLALHILSFGIITRFWRSPKPGAGTALQVRLATKAPPVTDTPNVQAAPKQALRRRSPGGGLRSSPPPPSGGETAPSLVEATPLPTPEELASLPPGYATAPPPSADLTYDVTDGSGASAAEGSVHWRIAERIYTLQINDGQRSLTSEGVFGDTGISPHRAIEEDAAGRRVSTFDRSAKKLSFSGSDRSYDVPESAQDPASLIIQLASIGNSDPATLDTDVVFMVGSGNAVAVVHIVPMGQEEIDTPLGKLLARRFRQEQAGGREQFEVWLAPDRHWLPVQMRTTRRDGSTLTQVIRRIVLAPAA